MYILFIYHMLPHNSGACLYNLKYICCPTTVILASQLWSYNPSPKSWRFSGEKNGSSPGKTTVSALICQRLNCGFFYFRRKNCHAVLDSRDDRGLPPESRLIRPHPIDCDRGPKQRVNIFPVFGFELCQFFFFKRPTIES